MILLLSGGNQASATMRQGNRGEYEKVEDLRYAEFPFGKLTWESTIGPVHAQFKPGTKSQVK